MSDNRTQRLLERMRERRGSADFLAHSMRMDVASLLQAKCAAMGLTQQDFADRVNKRPSFVSRVMHGDANLTLKTIGVLCHAVGVSPRLVDAAMDRAVMAVSCNVNMNETGVHDGRAGASGVIQAGTNRFGGDSSHLGGWYSSVSSGISTQYRGDPVLHDDPGHQFDYRSCEPTDGSRIGNPAWKPDFPDAGKRVFRGGPGNDLSVLFVGPSSVTQKK